MEEVNLNTPWSAISPSDSRSWAHDYWIEDSKGGCVGYWCGENEKWNLKKEQALLIASAPALLEALEEYMRANKALSACSYDDPIKLRAARDDFFDAEKDANAAIAAARGDL